jgi:hypothetical protein
MNSEGAWSLNTELYTMLSWAENVYREHIQ